MESNRIMDKVAKISWSQQVIEKGLLFLLAFTPLAFGTVQTWSIAIMEILSLAIFGAWIAFLNDKKNITLAKEPFLFLIGVMLLLVVFQIIPLHPGVLGFLSPETASL